MQPKKLIIKNFLKLLTKILQNYYIKYLLFIVFIISGYFTVIVFNNSTNHVHVLFCIFKRLTGIPCPGCGMGRATISLLKGNLIQSFNYNILGVPFTFVILISIFWLIADLLNHKESFFVFIGKEVKTPYKFLLLGILCIDWITNIIRQI